MVELLLLLTPIIILLQVSALSVSQHSNMSTIHAVGVTASALVLRMMLSATRELIRVFKHMYHTNAGSYSYLQ